MLPPMELRREKVRGPLVKAPVGEGAWVVRGGSEVGMGPAPVLVVAGAWPLGSGPEVEVKEERGDEEDSEVGRVVVLEMEIVASAVEEDRSEDTALVVVWRAGVVALTVEEIILETESEEPAVVVETMSDVEELMAVDVRTLELLAREEISLISAELEEITGGEGAVVEPTMSEVASLETAVEVATADGVVNVVA